MRHLRITLVVAAAVALGSSQAALGSPPATPEAERPPIPPVIWTLTAMQLGNKLSTPSNPTDYTVQFLPDRTMRIRADCNQGTGSYTADPPRLQLADLVTTKVACPPESLSDSFLEALAAVTAYQFQDDTLELQTSNGRLILKPQLTGVLWQWDRFLGGRGSGAAPADPSAYTIEFRDDGTVAVRADCNSGTGRFESTPPQLIMSDLSVTEMACPPRSLSDDFVRNLRDVRSFVFRGGQLYLTLMADAGIMIFSAQALPSDRATPTPG